MRPVILATGVVLMIAGIIGYANTDDVISYCLSEANKAGLFKGEYMQVCDKLPLLNYVMPIIVVIGIGLMGFGVIAKKKIKVEKLPQEKEEPQKSLTDDYVKMAKRFEEISEKYDNLEKRYTRLITYMKGNGIEIPDYVAAKIGL